ncbi:MAG: sulfoxide reductase heme-binding subunit YedZ [Gammaproteobacteria bacterium]|nr:sulfoxide reductase heme-binding subunit YedZ [Gammaproteobacteria bacterium]
MKKGAWTRPALFAACLIPLAFLVGRGASGNFGANPIEEITHFTGDWALYLLLLTLAVTPLRRLFGWSRLVRHRRMIGLFAFFYGVLHFLTYFVLDQFFDWAEIGKDIFKRPYITVGFSAFVLLVPLAVTSTDRMIRRLGGKRWKALHRLVYVSATLAVLHFLWLVKADVREPAICGVILATLLCLRLPWFVSLLRLLRIPFLAGSRPRTP